MIWEYLVAAKDGSHRRRAYGVPVDVSLDGKRLELVYQLPAPGQPCAVVHWQSGAVVAPIYDRHH